MRNVYETKLKNKLDEIVLSNRIQNKGIFIFGHCNAGEQIVDYLEENGFSVEAILDNNKNKIGMKYHKIVVKNPSTLLSYPSADCIVLIAARAYESMTSQLVKIGYTGETIKVVEYNTFSAYSLSERTFSEKSKRVQGGIRILEEIRCKYTSEYMVICPYDALGDVYYAHAFLKSYCRRHNIVKYVVCVIFGAYRSVSELFGTVNIVELNKEQMDELVQAVIFTKEKDCIIAHHDCPYSFDMIRYINSEFLNFLDFYRYGVFGLEVGDLPEIPQFKETTLKNLLIENRTVILSPYAKSIVGIPESYWESVVEEFKEKGFAVFTNVVGSEIPIKGTEGLKIQLSEIIATVEYAGIFVGIRSGLCDILSTAMCRKIVIYSDCFYSTSGWKLDEFFHLEGWEKRIYLP